MAFTYYLIPAEHQHQKSFYGKAFVVQDGETRTLWSYRTKIMVSGPNENMHRCWDGWSATTGKHIMAFCGLNKRRYKSLPYKKE